MPRSRFACAVADALRLRLRFSSSSRKTGGGLRFFEIESGFVGAMFAGEAEVADGAVTAGAGALRSLSRESWRRPALGLTGRRLAAEELGESGACACAWPRSGACLEGRSCILLALRGRARVHSIRPVAGCGGEGDLAVVVVLVVVVFVCVAAAA